MVSTSKRDSHYTYMSSEGSKSLTFSSESLKMYNIARKCTERNKDGQTYGEVRNLSRPQLFS